MNVIQENEENQKRISATALGYDPDHDDAPVVVASGRGKIAEEIIAAARKNNVPIHSDPILAESLGRVNINQAIPPELYIVVAEIFAYIYRIKAQQINQKGDQNEWKITLRPDANVDHLFRVVFPVDQRPIITIRSIQFPIIDICEIRRAISQP